MATVVLGFDQRRRHIFVLAGEAVRIYAGRK